MFLPLKGKMLGLDYGLRRIGLAITDPDRTMIFPRPLLLNTNQLEVFSVLKKLCQDESIVAIVVGYPYDDEHVENTQTAYVRTFGERLHEFVGVPVIFKDEKYTTAEAEAMMDLYGFDYKEKKSQRDSIAAMLILQSYVE